MPRYVLRGGGRTYRLDEAPQGRPQGADGRTLDTLSGRQPVGRIYRGRIPGAGAAVATASPHILFDAATISPACHRAFHHGPAWLCSEVQCQKVVAQTLGHILISSADADRDVYLEEPDTEPRRAALHRTAATGFAPDAIH